MNLVSYARVSSAEQVNGYSIDAQNRETQQWALKHGHNISRVFVEAGMSARSDKRRVFQEMISYVCGSDYIGGLVVHNSDRFARNLLDQLTYLDLLSSHGKRLFSVTEPYLNEESAENRLAARIVAAVSEYTSDKIGRESMKGRIQKAKSGSWHGGRPPLGYIRDNQKRLIAHPQLGPMMTQAFKAFASGKFTLRQWVNEATQRGYKNHYTQKSISRSGWQSIFRNIFFTGKYIFQEQTYQGDHPALVDDETFHLVQTILEQENSGGASQRHFWLLKGLLSSEEGRKMYGSKAAKGNRYYLAGETRVRAGDLEARVVDCLATIRGHVGIAPDYIRGAMQMTEQVESNNLKHVWGLMNSQEEQRRLLQLIFLPWGVVVGKSGAIVETKIYDQFRYIR